MDIYFNQYIMVGTYNYQSLTIAFSVINVYGGRLQLVYQSVTVVLPAQSLWNINCDES